jgi:SNF2 family DNA or RNA helicase
LLLGQLAEFLERHKAIEEDMVEIDLEPEEFVDWEEGVEHLRSKTEVELYAMLGFNDMKIPFMNTEVDDDSDICELPYANAQGGNTGEKMAPPPGQKKPFALKWHQLVGLTKIVQSALTSQPVLLMDNVGLGKTVQVIAFFAVMAYYRKFYTETHRYPGMWSESNTY